MARRPPEAPGWFQWTLVGVLAVLLLAGSLAPVSSGPGPAEPDVVVDVPLDNENGVAVSVPSDIAGISLFALAHVLGYATLAAALAWALSGSRLLRMLSGSSTGLQVVLTAMLATVAYSVAVELLQGPVASRTFSYHDIALNAFGATLGLACRELLAW